MQTTYKKRICGAVVLALVAIALVTMEVWSAAWVAAVSVSQTTPILQQDNVDVALGSDSVVVAWAKGGPDYGLALSKYQNNAWSTSYVNPQIIGQRVWSPSVVDSGSQLAAAWAEGASHGTCSVKLKVRQHDQGGSTRTILDNIYSPATAPDLAVGTSGWHMVFAAATSESDCTSAKVNLYYAYRASVASSWSAPTAIVTHSTALADGADVGGISYPRIATVGTKVYVVWEQEQRTISPPNWDSNIWYVEGTMQGGSPVWSQPVQLSPAAQYDAVRPSVAMGADGKVHVVWTNLIGGRGQPDEQHIYYRRVDQAAPQALNTAPVRVTGNFPTLAASSVAISGQQVCASWHGYTGAVGSGREEITVRCSYDNGATFASAVNVSDSHEWLSIFPSVAVGSDDLMHFAWVEYQVVDNAVQPVAVYYRNSQPASHQVFMPLVVRSR